MSYSSVSYEPLHVGPTCIMQTFKIIIVYNDNLKLHGIITSYLLVISEIRGDPVSQSQIKGIGVNKFLFKLTSEGQEDESRGVRGACTISIQCNFTTNQPINIVFNWQDKLSG